MIPTAELRVEAHMTIPPTPIGFHVVVKKQTIGVLTWDEVKRAHDQYAAMKELHKSTGTER